MGAAAAAPVFKTIATEALRMLDVPKDIPEDLVADAKQPKQPVQPVPDDVSIPDLVNPSIMEEDASVQQLLASQMKPEPEEKQDEDGIPAAPAVLAVLPQPKPPVPRGPLVPDFRGKSMRDVAEEASAEGIEVMVEGSGVARAQLPLPGKPLRRGERIRIVFTR
jgi:cell division protein FtsI (penicillin-binding protein 3)